MVTLGVLRRLAADPECASRIAALRAPVRQMQAVAQLLARKADAERKYLARLEGALSSRKQYGYLPPGAAFALVQDHLLVLSNYYR